MLLFMAWFHLSDPPWICNGSLARQPLVSVVVDGCHQQTQMPMLLLQGGVFIHEIHAGGAAEKSGALHHGDLVTKVPPSKDCGAGDAD